MRIIEKEQFMKVAVITLKDSPNYGGILQAYALQRVIEKLGHDCYLIDYMNDEFRHKFTFFVFFIIAVYPVI